MNFFTKKMNKKLLSTLLICVNGLFLFAQTNHINENFNAGTLPTGWTNTANTGTHVWEFGLDGSVDAPGNNNLDGSAMAYFDDSQHLAASTQDNATLETPAFDNSSFLGTFLEFDYNFRKELPTDLDSFYVEVFDGTSWNVVFSETSNNCGDYLICTSFPHVKVDISAYANSACKVRFNYYDGGNWGWYAALDNVHIYSPLPNDIGVVAVVDPQSACGLTASEPITVRIFNYGANSQSNFPISYSLNGGTPVTETVSQTLNVNDTINYTFTATANLSNVGLHDVDVWTGLVTDGAAFNDSISVSVRNFRSYGLTYNESFESGAGGWTTYGANSSWNRGLPTASNINTAPNGNVIFGTNTFGSYNNSETSFLESPCLDLSGGIADPILSFSLYYNSESPWDRLDMQISTDNGATWSNFAGAPNARNWYNVTTQGVWAGNSGGWLSVETVLTGLNGQNQVKIRFRYRTDNQNIAGNGIGIDNVSIRSPQAIDMAVNELSYPVSSGTPECGFGMESIIIEVENKGANTANSYIISYRVDGGTVVSETVNNPLASNTTRSHIFSTRYDFSVIKNYLIDIWVEIAGDGFSPNDSILNNSISNSSIGSVPISYTQNFDSFTAGSQFSNNNDAIGGGWTRNSSAAGVYTWRVSDGDIANLSTNFPNADHTTGSGNFMYTEASNGTSGNIATLTSPCLDLSTNLGARMSFWFHRFGAQITSPIIIDVYDGIQWVQNVDQVTTKQVSGASPWLYKEVDLNAFAGRKIKVRFRATSGGCCAGDMAIDDVVIWEPLPQDAQANMITQPQGGCDLTFGNITVQLENFGTQVIAANTLQVSFSNNGSTPVTETVPTSIPVGGTLNYTFTNQVDLRTSGSQNIIVWTDLNGDSNTANDSTPIYSITNRSVKLPRYFCNFEAFDPGPPIDLDGWRRVGGPHRWEIYKGEASANIDGSMSIPPTGASGDHTFSTSKGNGHGTFIMTNTDLGNFNRNDAIIEMPCNSIDFSSSRFNKVLLSFWYHIYGPNTHDLFVDVHDGSSWNLAVGVVRGQGNAAQPQPQSEDTDLWLEHFVDLSQFATIPTSNQLKIRFRAQYSEDPANNSPATGGDIGLDDVEILDRIPVDGAVKEFLSPETDCALASNEQVSVEVMNYGINDIIQLNMGYQVDFVPWGGGSRQSFAVQKDSAVGILILPLARYTFDFDERVDMTASGAYFFKVWTEQVNDSNVYNDTLYYTVVNETRPFPSCEDFSSLTDGDQPKDFLDEKFPHPNNWVGTTAAFTWTATSTGPGFGPAAGTTGGANDLYLSVDFSQGTTGAIARIESPCFDLTNAPSAILTFNYVVNGPSARYFVVDIRPSQGGNWIEGIDTIFPPSPATTNWTQKEVVLTDYVGNFANLRLRTEHPGPDNAPGAVAIDDICIVQPPPQQIELERILSPKPGLCFYSNAEPLRLRVQNVGRDRIDSFQVIVALDTTAIATPRGSSYYRDTVWARITQAPFFEAGDKLDITIPGLSLDMSHKVTYFLSVYLLLNGDLNPDDNLLEDVEIFHQVPDVLSYFENFEALGGQGGPVYSNRYERKGGDYQWGVKLGPNRPGFTGPVKDHTRGQYGAPNGRYFVTNSRVGEFGDAAILETPCIELDCSVQPVIRYWYHMFGLDMGRMYLEINDDSGWEKIDSLIGEKHSSHNDPWSESPIINLSAYAGKTVKFRFRSLKGSGDLSDMAIDDIRIYCLSPKDIAPDRLVRPNGWRTSCYTDTQSVYVQLRNFGTDSLDFTFDSVFIDVDIYKDNAFWANTNTMLNTNIWSDPNGVLRPLPQDSLVTVRMDNTFDMGDIGPSFRFEISVDMHSDSVLTNNSLLDTVVTRRRGGSIQLLTTANEICIGSAVNMQVNNYFGALRWESRQVTNGISGPWTKEFNFPFDSATYTAFPPNSQQQAFDSISSFWYRVKVCDTIYSDSAKINLRSVPDVDVINDSVCGSGMMTFGADPNSNVDSVFFYASAGAYAPFAKYDIANAMITDFYTESDTFYMQGVVDSCYSPNRIPVYASVNPFPVFDWDSIFYFKGVEKLGPNNYALCKDTTIVLDGGLVPGRKFTFKWTITHPAAGGGDSIVTDTNSSVLIDPQSLEKDKTYSYKVQTTTDSMCVATSPTIFITVRDSCVTGISEELLSRTLKIYPNPSSGVINISIGDNTNKPSTLSITNIQGAVVYEEQDPFRRESNFTIDLSDKAEGVYFVKLRIDDQIVVKKLVIQ